MPDLDAAVIYTVGHSTRSFEQLVDVLTEADIEELVDVRSIPRSRRHPQFSLETLASSLPDHGIAYRHERALGGFRRPVQGSPNGGWDEPAFRGYADHMRSEQFRDALDRLQAHARAHVVSVMCAEAQWWRCHRRLIADALVIRGWRVAHLGLRADPIEHELTPFAVIGADHQLTYPPRQGELALENA